MRWQAAVKASCLGQLFIRAGRPGWRDSEKFAREEGKKVGWVKI